MLPHGPIAHARHVAQIPQVQGFTSSVCRWVCWTCARAQAEVGRLGAPPGCFQTSSPVYICFLFFLITTSLGPLLAVLPVQGDLGDLPPRAWEQVSSLHCVLKKGRGDSHFEGSDDIIFLCLRIKYRPPFIFNLHLTHSTPSYVELSFVQHSALPPLTIHLRVCRSPATPSRFSYSAVCKRF